MVFKKCCITTRTKKNQYTLCTGFSFCLHNGRGSNKAAAHSAASNQPSGLLLRVTGCGSQHPPRALGGTCVLLAAAPTTPPCIGHRPQSSLLQVPAQEREQVIAFVGEIDMLAEARKVIDAVLASLSVQFDLKG